MMNRQKNADILRIYTRHISRVEMTSIRDESPLRASVCRDPVVPTPTEVDMNMGGEYREEFGGHMERRNCYLAEDDLVLSSY
jgi:hypothetical protein